MRGVLLESYLSEELKDFQLELQLLGKAMVLLMLDNLMAKLKDW